MDSTAPQPATLPGLPAPLPTNDTVRLGLLRVAASVANGPIALDASPVAYPVVFQGISFACPRLKLYGFSTERKVRNAMAREFLKLAAKGARLNRA